MPSESMPSHYAIFDYWKDKCITRDGKVYTWEKVQFKDIDVKFPIEDWGEPQCWACGKIIRVEDEQNYDEWLENSDYKSIYGSKILKHELNRAHIVPKAITHNNNPSNLFLLCESCHKLSPDCRDKRMFISWVYKRKTQLKDFNIYLLKALKILRDDFRLLHPSIDTEDIANKIYGKNCINSHGSAISESTFVYGIVQNALKNQTALSEENEIMFKKELAMKILEIEKEDAKNPVIGIYKEVLAMYEKYKNIECNEDIISPLLDCLKFES